MKRPSSFSVIAPLLVVSLAYAADGCVDIKTGKTGSAVIKDAGSYCMNRQMTINGKYNPWVWEGSKYLSDDHMALVIAANDVHVDLKGNAIVSNARAVMAGVQSALANTGESTNFAARAGNFYRKRSWDAAFRDITVSDGSIDLNRGEIGVAFSGSSWNYGWVREGVSLNAQFVQELYAESFDLLPTRAVDYPVRRITVENMKIRSPNYGVVVQGAKTVIRNSVIETDSQVGIWIFGPDAIIENNTIIVHERDKDSIHPIRAHDAPIRLHQADGTIVRNNRIVMRSGIFSRTKGAAAIDLLDSKNVLIEGNTIEDFKELLRKDGASTATEQRNQLN